MWKSLIFISIQSFLLIHYAHSNETDFAKVLEPSKQLRLDNCPYKGENFKEWLFLPTGDKGEKEVDKAYVKETENGTIVVIDKPSKSNAGTYTCRPKMGGHPSYTYNVRAKPDINEFKPGDDLTADSKSVPVIENETFELFCEVDDEPGLVVTWYKSDEEPTPDKNITDKFKAVSTLGDRFQIDGPEKKDHKQKIHLKLTKVTADDRAFYICHAHNGVAENMKFFQLRVKDKLAALWPFLGIVGEVVILCTIICIYEKRRVKPDFDDSDEGQGAEGKSPQSSSKGQEVRQRK